MRITNPDRSRARSWVAGMALLMGVMGALPTQATAQSADTVTVEINAIPGIRFDRVRFQVQPGVPVKILFENRDPVADMDHNLVVARPGTREQVVLAGMQAGLENHYVPSLPEIIAFTPQLSAGESYTLNFTAPTEAGAYPYVCTFPGHGYVMFGVMYVGQEMPALASDENVPEGQRAGVDLPMAGGAPPPGPPGAAQQDPPGPKLSYGTTFPAISRTFMPESGPASIAVGFEGGESFNFDAGGVFLRYAWSGGFVDNWPHWRGNGNAYATVEGEVYYRTQLGVPLRVGSRAEVEEVDFLGYQLDAGDIPEFRYAIDGAAVRERIVPRAGGGLERTFRIESSEPIQFLSETDSGVRYESSVGRWQDGVLTLTPAQAREFTITMIPVEGGAP